MKRRLAVLLTAGLVSASGVACAGVEDEIRDRAREEVEKQRQRVEQEVDKQRQRVEQEVNKQRQRLNEKVKEATQLLEDGR